MLRDGFAYEMLIAHEHQHNETMLQLLQMVDGYEPPLERPDPAADRRPAAPRWSASTVVLTRSAPPAPASPTTTSGLAIAVELGPFRIDRRPVSNGDFAEFVAETGAEPPLYWERDGEGDWVDTTFGRRTELDREAARGPRRPWPGERLRGWAG